MYWIFSFLSIFLITIVFYGWSFWVISNLRSKLKSLKYNFEFTKRTKKLLIHTMLLVTFILIILTIGIIFFKNTYADFLGKDKSADDELLYNLWFKNELSPRLIFAGAIWFISLFPMILTFLPLLSIRPDKNKENFCLDFSKMDISDELLDFRYYDEYKTTNYYLSSSRNNLLSSLVEQDKMDCTLLYNKMKTFKKVLPRKFHIRRLTNEVIKISYFIPQLSHLDEEERIYHLLSILYQTLIQLEYIKDINEWKQIMQEKYKQVL